MLRRDLRCEVVERLLKVEANARLRVRLERDVLIDLLDRKSGRARVELDDRVARAKAVPCPSQDLDDASVDRARHDLLDLRDDDARCAHDGLDRTAVDDRRSDVGPAKAGRQQRPREASAPTIVAPTIATIADPRNHRRIFCALSRGRSTLPSAGVGARKVPLVQVVDSAEANGDRIFGPVRGRTVLCAIPDNVVLATQGGPPVLSCAYRLENRRRCTCRSHPPFYAESPLRFARSPSRFHW